MQMLMTRLLMPTDAADSANAADIERGHTAVVGSKDAFSSNCNSY